MQLHSEHLRRIGYQGTKDYKNFIEFLNFKYGIKNFPVVGCLVFNVCQDEWGKISARMSGIQELGNAHACRMPPIHDIDQTALWKDFVSSGMWEIHYKMDGEYTGEP